MITMSIPEFHDALKAQGVPSPEDLAFVCPGCRTVQSARDFIAAGAGGAFEEVEKYLGFSCVGRFTGADTPRGVPDGKPCNWTLGGLFKIHELEVIDGDGKRHPRFLPASPERAQEHARRVSETAGAA